MAGAFSAIQGTANGPGPPISTTTVFGWPSVRPSPVPPGSPAAPGSGDRVLGLDLQRRPHQHDRHIRLLRHLNRLAQLFLSSNGPLGRVIQPRACNTSTASRAVANPSQRRHRSFWPSRCIRRREQVRHVAQSPRSFDLHLSSGSRPSCSSAAQSPLATPAMTAADVPASRSPPAKFGCTARGGPDQPPASRKRSRKTR